MATFKLDGQNPYIIQQPETIPTPRLLVFKDRVTANTERLTSYLRAVVPQAPLRHLCPHVKTHKSSYIVRFLMEQGIAAFKATPNEVDMLARCGVNEVFVAYPLLKHDAAQLTLCMSSHPETEFYVQMGSLTHAEVLRDAARVHNVRWRYFIDLDVGMHRTGIQPDKAFDLYSEVSRWPEFEFAGLHGYDGHIHHPDEAERLKESQKAMGMVLDVFETFRKNGLGVPRVMTSGSISFQTDFEILHNQIGTETLVQVSPGNWIYWDSGYDAIIPGQFEMAAAILAQVIDVWGTNRLTLNLGHKRWGADRGPVERFSPEGLRVVSFNEEHTVLESTDHQKYAIGDYVLIIPKHACSTVNLYEAFTVIGNEGQVEVPESPVDARNR